MTAVVPRRGAQALKDRFEELLQSNAPGGNYAIGVVEEDVEEGDYDPSVERFRDPDTGRFAYGRTKVMADVEVRGKSAPEIEEILEEALGGDAED